MYKKILIVILWFLVFSISYSYITPIFPPNNSENINPEIITFKWEASPTNYKYFYFELSDESTVIFKKILSSNFVSVSSLKPLHSYTWKVEIRDEEDKVIESSIFHFKTGDYLPGTIIKKEIKFEDKKIPYNNGFLLYENNILYFLDSYEREIWKIENVDKFYIDPKGNILILTQKKLVVIDSNGLPLGNIDTNVDDFEISSKRIYILKSHVLISLNASLTQTGEFYSQNLKSFFVSEKYFILKEDKDNWVLDIDLKVINSYQENIIGVIGSRIITKDENNLYLVNPYTQHRYNIKLEKSYFIVRNRVFVLSSDNLLKAYDENAQLLWTVKLKENVEKIVYDDNSKSFKVFGEKNVFYLYDPLVPVKKSFVINIQNLKPLNIVFEHFKQKNSPPSIKIIYPLSSTKTAPQVTFRWEGTDPDNDPLTYYFYLQTDESTKNLKEIKTIKTSLSLFLDEGKKYKWKVKAQDPKGLSAESSWTYFSTVYTDQLYKDLQKKGYVSSAVEKDEKIYIVGYIKGISIKPFFAVLNYNLSFDIFKVFDFEGFLYDIKILQDDFVVCGGIYNEANNYDSLIMRIKPNGEILWKISFGSFGKDFVRNITIWNDDIYAVSAYETSEKSYQILFSKITSEGQRIISKEFGGFGDELPRVIESIRYRNFIIVGTTNSYGSNDYNEYITVIDEMGGWKWERFYGSDGNEFPVGIINLKDSILVFSKVIKEKEFDLKILKIDYKGNEIWKKYIRNFLPMGIKKLNNSVLVFGLKDKKGEILNLDFSTKKIWSLKFKTDYIFTTVIPVKNLIFAFGMEKNSNNIFILRFTY